ncbi:DUF2971 domain-containing protein [Rhodocaloribacter sp.]
MDHLEKELSRKPPGLLYHYTSQRGLLGILKNNEIWATKIQYLSDGSEFVYFVDCLKERIGFDKDQCKKLRSLNNEVAKRGGRVLSDEELNKLAEGIISPLESVKNRVVFVCSFSEEANLLSQWRAYCPPDGGFSIGFDSGILKEICNKGKSRFSLNPCIYEREKQNKIIDELIIEVIRKVGIHGAVLFEKYDDNMIYMHKFMEIASIFKHPSFCEEREWRLVSRVNFDQVTFNDDQVDFREGKSMIVPYFKIELPKETESPIKEVIVGPTPHKDLSIASVEGLLTRKKIKIEAEVGEENEKKTVKWCGIPYRTW